ncbi:ATP-binding cassette sub-family F member 3 [Capsaspora owczarzaki ATCC 30864]|uniref:ATP-binding cassette sub-family F member 3 n=1 Tax=Capsaspora owczarzaki (strain ATCC 30864) TaxID=595528 RepID=A0A0D2VRI4_CAPO3|nr:ATP-binding cassette sub-family F member 3 [Capsaspora owczarzaki ATCC 30864]KJE93482.1 ATP-binding cassette sub-family F member 3 [Capsaspora owczarzaki ATCC 30864]|eukprot:XP_004348094.1 ATP-binding cassette sub-family F member 3 [Capsaspora owczarzaki ATCC 30864]
MVEDDASIVQRALDAAALPATVDPIALEYAMGVLVQGWADFAGSTVDEDTSMLLDCIGPHFAGAFNGDDHDPALEAACKAIVTSLHAAQQERARQTASVILPTLPKRADAPVEQAVVVGVAPSSSATKPSDPVDAAVQPDTRADKEHGDEDDNEEGNSDNSSSETEEAAASHASHTDAFALEADPEPDLEEMAHAACMTRGRFPPGESRDVNLSNLVLAQGPRDLLVNATLKLFYNHRYGLVGRNGVGKSTLMKRIAMYKIAGFPKHLRTFYVSAEAPGSAKTALEFVLAADSERAALLREEAGLTRAESGQESNPERLVEIYARLQEIDADSATQRALVILNGLGFDDVKLALPTSQLSGGWRMRLSLACALFLHPDILLLDEPEAHLDAAGQHWLQNFLSEYSGCVVVVSHSAPFLTAVTTDILHFHHRKLDHYPCDYPAFVQAREDKQKKQIHLQTDLDRRRQQLTESMRKMEAKAAGNARDQKRLQQVASRKKKLNRMGFEKTADGRKFNSQLHGIREGAINANTGGWKGGKRSAASTVLYDEPSIRFQFEAATAIGAPDTALIQLQNVGFGFATAEASSTAAAATTPKLLFSKVTLEIFASTRLALLGLNGQGKSTLLKLIGGLLEPVQGQIVRHRQACIMHFNQHHVDQLNLDQSPVQHLFGLWLAHRDATRANTMGLSGSTTPQERQMLFEHEEQNIRRQLGHFGIGSPTAYQRIATLSGGQRTRVALACLTFLASPHVLLLDEVTNCLDIESIESLQNALQKFQGAVVLVSHHGPFVDAVCTDLRVVERGRLSKLDGVSAVQYMADLDDS